MQFANNTKEVITLALFCAVSGCGGRGRSNQQLEASPLKPLVKFYGDYVNQHQGRPPAGEAEFKAFLKESKNADWLKAEFKIADIDKLLISPRDNKPYVIYYGTKSKNIGPGGASVVAYEKEGLGGKRFVASALGAVEEVDEAAFRKMVPDGG
ncbi:MAG: hypothetical protein ACR2FY_02870 [Pirellulaceae bacterium]